ncbi:CPBP family intramembrane glutamic endopeptidase [Haloplanus sp. GCM10025708]|uniref:CPBP family intramembrane glutamic endopeptidase n=1 Tax=Haloferacaceae TaxID=1644056 RepID=UPI003605C1E6
MIDFDADSDADVRSRVRALIVAVAVSLSGLAVGFAVVFGLGAVVVGAGVRPTPLTALAVSLVAIQGVAFGGVALAYLRYRGWGVGALGVRAPDVRELLVVVAGYALAIAAAVVGAVAVSVTGLPVGENQVADVGRADPTAFLWLIPASFLLIGPGEELLFRGVVQGRLRETFAPVSGVALASAVFAAVHFVALTGGAGGRLVTISVLFLPSLVFGAVYELTDNLVVPALVHGAYNATLFLLAYVAFRLMGA